VKNDRVADRVVKPFEVRDRLGIDALDRFARLAIISAAAPRLILLSARSTCARACSVQSARGSTSRRW
jgi:hypothetical protein